MYDEEANFKGFDVVIGNPPYVELNKMPKAYKLINYLTLPCGNLFNLVTERGYIILNRQGRIGLIIPLSSVSTDRMIPFISFIKSHSEQLLVSNFSWRPGKLFDTVNLQLSIIIGKKGNSNVSHKSSSYILWDSSARNELFSKMTYEFCNDETLKGSIPKIGLIHASSILSKIRAKKLNIDNCLVKSSNNLIFYRRGGLYWKVFVDFETGSSEEKTIHLSPEVDKYSIISALSSSLWFWYLQLTSDCRHLGNRDINTFPFYPGELSEVKKQHLSRLGRRLVDNLKNNAEDTVRVYKGTKTVNVLSFKVNQSKPIIDEIDTLLASHYGFTEEELDFIINYDIKYRMGGEGQEE
jgi:Eco57I restriction-modification methylase